jgi:tight adherence protein B
MTFAIVAFVVTICFILGPYWMFVVRPEQRAHLAVSRRLNMKGGNRKVRGELLKRAQRRSSVPAFDAVLKRGRAGLHPVERLIEQSGSRMTVGAFLVTSGLVALVMFTAVYRVTGFWLLALPLAALSASVPTAVLRVKRTKRLLQFEEQFPEALDLMSRALKAGHAFTTGLGMVAEEMPAPVGPEFKLLHEQQNFGMPLADALKAFARRIPLLDGRFFVTAVLIQRDSGGNLSEVLENLAGVIRDRFKVKRQIRVISAHGRMTGWVLTGVPPALALVLFIINPDHWKTLVGDPLGVKLIVTGIVLQITGGLTIRKLVQLEY